MLLTLLQSRRKVAMPSALVGSVPTREAAPPPRALNETIDDETGWLILSPFPIVDTDKEDTWKTAS